MVSFTLFFFPALKDSGLGDTFKNLPPQLAKLVGDTLSFTTIQGYVGEQLFGLRMPMMTIVLAIVLFTGITATEEDRGSVAGQLTLPISRSRLLMNKYLAAASILAIVHVGIAVGILATLAAINESLSVWHLFQTIAGCWLLSLSIGSLVFLLGASTGLKTLTVGIGSYIVFQSYLLSSLVSTIKDLEMVEKLSLFHYYPSLQIMKYGMSGQTLAVFSLTILVSVDLALLAFNHRDIRS